MRKLISPVFLLMLVLAFACDTHEASFEESLQNTYSLSTDVVPANGGNISPSAGEFSEEEVVQIEANPLDGFVFDRWEGDLTGNSNPQTLTFDSNKSVTAHFSIKDYLLTIEIEGNGTVTETVLEDTENNGNENPTSKKIKVEANSNEGWFFDHWEGDLTGSSNPDTITVDEEKTVTAIFKEEIAEDEFLLSVDTDGEGRVEKDPDRSTYSQGERVVLTAVSENGWMFDRWRGDLSGSENPVTITIDGDKSVTAVFEREEITEIFVNEVKLFVDELELSGLGGTEDFKTRNFILNLPIDGEPFRITHTEIPAGFYDELELEISEPDDDIDIGDPDFENGNRKYSLVVKGSYQGISFIFRSDEDFDIEADLNPPRRISEGDNSVIPLFSDFENWFKDSDGSILDPNDPLNKDTINKNIEDSFSD